MTDYYYVKPDCSVKGGVEGEDYFVCVREVKEFAERNYGWRGDGKSGVERSSSSSKRRSVAKVKDQVQTNGKRQRCEEAHPEPAKASKSSASASSNASHGYDKKALWQALQKGGWRAINAGKYNNLHE